MKRILVICMCLLMALSMAGCGAEKKNDRGTAKKNTVNDVLEQGMKEEDAGEAQTEKNAAQDAAGDSTAEETDSAGNKDRKIGNTEGVDIDLIGLNRTLVYSEVANMVNVPTDYIGKVIRMKGECIQYIDPETQNYYYTCFVRDAAACCQNGIEFILTEDKKIPDDYPQDGEQIIVRGTFSTYEENGQLFCTLKDAQLEEM